MTKKTDKEAPKTNAIFLEEGTLVKPERPPRSGYIRMPQFYAGSTKLKSFVSHNYFHRSVGDYLVGASAATYLANVIRCDGKTIAEEDEREPHEERVFDGGIVIYQECQIPGTDIRGLDLLTTGRIWFGRLPQEVPRTDNVLFSTIFPTDDPREIQKTINKIVEGYELQAEADARAHHTAVNGAASRARADENERIFGTFGRGW